MTIARFSRAELIEVMQADYILTAKAKGISQGVIIVKHALRNALIPVVTILGPMVAALITGTLVIEQIYAVPGLGEQFVKSITLNDYTVIMGTTIFYSAIFILVIFIVDILYGIIDPRIRLAGGKMMKDVQKLSPDLFQQANQNNVDNEVIARQA